MAVSSTDPAVALELVLLTLDNIASALDWGAALCLLSLSKAELGVAGDGVCVGVQGEGGPGVELWDPGSWDKGASVMTWVTSLDKHSSICWNGENI